MRWWPSLRCSGTRCAASSSISSRTICSRRGTPGVRWAMATPRRAPMGALLVLVPRATRSRDGTPVRIRDAPGSDSRPRRRRPPS
eukprot:10164606-Lingulodinium_polyedra.AAC.1